MKLPFEIVTDLLSQYINIDEVRSKSRLPHIVRRRFILIYLLKKYTTVEVTQIGRYVDRSHDNCIYAINAVKNMLWTKDPEYTYFLNKIESIIINHIKHLAA